jgi:ribosomal protein S18 acetylase RimI-like enzyme
MNRKYDFVPLEWDTQYFGIKSARLNLWDIPDENEQDQITKLCAEYDFVTISNIGNLKENNQWIGRKSNAFLTDINIQFAKIITANSAFPKETVYVVNNYPRNDAILRIASDSFIYSRFFNDEWLPQHKVKQIYRHWTECAFNQENKYFAICEKQGNVAGYILSMGNIENCEIELIAVDKKYQGQGVGKALIQKLETHAMGQGYKKITVGTQVDNIHAAQFYSKMGFIYASCNSIYHWWSRVKYDD